MLVSCLLVASLLAWSGPGQVATEVEAPPCARSAATLQASARARVDTSCEGSAGDLFGGDRIELGPGGHVRLDARVGVTEIDELTCVNASPAPVSLTIAVDARPYFTVVGGTCSDIVDGELTCATGDRAEAVVCSARVRSTVTQANDAETRQTRTDIRVAESAPAPGDVVRDDAHGDVERDETGGVLQRTARRRPLRIVVYDLALEGVEPRVGRLVTEATLTEVRKRKSVTVVGLDEVRAMLEHEAEAQAAGCATDESCLSEIADALGADELVLGSLGRQGGRSVFTLKRIHQREAKVLGSVSRGYPAADGEEFFDAVGDAVGELYGDVPLRAGEAAGVDERYAERLNPPPLSPWVFYAGVGVTGLLAVGAAAAGGAFAYSQLDYTSYAYQDDPVSGPALQNKSTQLIALAVVADVLIAATLLHAAGVGVSAWFVDWSGAADASNGGAE